MASLKVQGLNHLTLAVSDVGRSVAFYCDLLGYELRAQWCDGAYVEAGSLWLCLSRDEAAKTVSRTDYTHIAFDVEADAFEALAEAVMRKTGVWKENRSEGHSLYFLDPDGHKLELHVGSLAARLAHYRANPIPDRKIVD